MADISDEIQRGKSVDYPQSAVGTTSHNITKDYRANLIGAVSAGAARIEITPSGMPLAVKYLDLDFDADVTDLVFTDAKLSPGDTVDLTLDEGAVGFVLMRIQNPREA